MAEKKVVEPCCSQPLCSCEENPNGEDEMTCGNSKNNSGVIQPMQVESIKDPKDSIGITDGLESMSPGQNGSQNLMGTTGGLESMSPGQNGSLNQMATTDGLESMSPGQNGSQNQLGTTDGLESMSPGQNGSQNQMGTTDGLESTSPRQNGSQNQIGTTDGSAGKKMRCSMNPESNLGSMKCPNQCTVANDKNRNGTTTYDPVESAGMIPPPCGNADPGYEQLCYKCGAPVKNGRTLDSSIPNRLGSRVGPTMAPFDSFNPSQMQSGCGCGNPMQNKSPVDYSSYRTDYSNMENTGNLSCPFKTSCKPCSFNVPDLSNFQGRASSGYGAGPIGGCQTGAGRSVTFPEIPSNCCKGAYNKNPIIPETDKRLTEGQPDAQPPKDSSLGIEKSDKVDPLVGCCESAYKKDSSPAVTEEKLTESEPDEQPPKDSSLEILKSDEVASPASCCESAYKKDASTPVAVEKLAESKPEEQPQQDSSLGIVESDKVDPLIGCCESAYKKNTNSAVTDEQLTESKAAEEPPDSSLEILKSDEEASPPEPAVTDENVKSDQVDSLPCGCNGTSKKD